VDAGLAEAYRTDYVGTAATDFIQFIKIFEHGYIYPTHELYAKAVPVVQSSGTGKSRMLTEVGCHISVGYRGSFRFLPGRGNRLHPSYLHA
jgi:hypothetical protein